MSNSPTQRSLVLLRELGFTAQVVEKFNFHSKTRLDLFGIIDIIAIHPGAGIFGIQATSGSNHSARRVKSMDEPNLRLWLEAGGRFEVWSWAKKGPRGKRKVWQVRREEITLDML